MLVRIGVLIFLGIVFWVYLQMRRNNLTDYEKQAFLDVPDIIRIHGYEMEEHVAITADGYLLKLHRILARNTNDNVTKSPVLIMHGHAESSAEFIMMGPENSLAFLLADNGYDVWLGNMRGNYYSNGHTKLNNDDNEYWKFSMDEKAVIDAPTMIDYVLGHTGYRRLIYIGYSSGGTVPFFLTSERPEYNNKMKSVIVLAPSVFVTNRNNPLLPILYISNILDYFRINLLHRHHLKADFFRAFCSEGKPLHNIYMKIFGFLSGSPENNFNKTLIPVLFGHMPAGSSTLVDTHLIQLMKSGGLPRFDYGVLNRKNYGQDSPPQYNVDNFNAPLYFFCGTEDKVVTCESAEILFSKLPHVEDKHIFEISNTTHFDFIYGVSARRKIYDNILKILENS